MVILKYGTLYSLAKHLILHINTEDVRVTELIRETGEMLDIAVLDHLVIGGNRFVSLKERGLGFK